MREDDRVTSNERENYSKEGYILPNHYYLGKTYQTIDIIQDQLSDKAFIGFCKFLVIKYLIRVEDGNAESKFRAYKKASYYLNELINRRAKTSEKANKEKINPQYYKKHELEVVDLVEDQFEEEELDGAYKGVIIKYLLRAEKKHGIEDYQKANYFLDRLINYYSKKLEEPTSK